MAFEPAVARDAIPFRPRGGRRDATLLDSYRQLASLFHDVLSEQTLESLLESIADNLAELVPYDALSIYQADEGRQRLFPVFARCEWREQILSSRPTFGEGLTGWAAVHREPVLANAAHLDPRVALVPGTPVQPEALIAVPLVARGALKGVLNIYREGEQARFDQDDFELAKRFGDAAALALDNAEIRANLEHQAQTDSLTGLYNHRFFYDRLRAELHRASRVCDTVSVLMMDIDDFKRVNDVYGHGVGDGVLAGVADVLRATLRESDVPCRIGGEEFAVIVPSYPAGEAERLAARLVDALAAREFSPAGRVTLSIGIAEGPRHAMNPRELVACADGAMLAAKARGKNRTVVYAGEAERGEPGPERVEVRALAHLRLLERLPGRVNSLRDATAIGEAVADELRSLIDYHNCRVYGRAGDILVPLAFRGDGCEDCETGLRALTCRVGEGVTGTAAARAETIVVPNTAECEFARYLPGTEAVVESLVAAPISYGSRVLGVLVVSQLGKASLDAEDGRLLEMVAGQAALALENARLYAEARREADVANSLLEFGRRLANTKGVREALEQTAELTARMLEAPKASVWVQDPATGELVAEALWGYGDGEREHALAVRYPREEAERLLRVSAPFVLSAADVRRIDGNLQAVARAVAPMTFGEERLGCIVAWASETEGDPFPEPSLRVLAGLADQAKLALKNAF